jgi:hypothetical protein
MQCHKLLTSSLLGPNTLTITFYEELELVGLCDEFRDLSWNIIHKATVFRKQIFSSLNEPSPFVSNCHNTSFSPQSNIKLGDLEP